MNKKVEKNEFTAGVQQILTDYRDILSFQDRVILARKFTQKGKLSVESQQVVEELDCNWVDITNATHKLLTILRVKNKWLHDETTKLAQADEDKNAAVISWLNQQRKKNAKLCAHLSALRDDEKKTDEKARLEWREDRAKQLDPKKKDE
jgi:hypothetical protein